MYRLLTIWHLDNKCLQGSPFWLSLAPSSALSWNLPHGVCMASWLPCVFPLPSALRLHGFLVIWAIPDSLPISSMLDRHQHLIFLALSASFPEGSPNICEAVQDRLGKMRKPWRQVGCPYDVRRTMQAVCRRCHKVHFCMQILLWTKTLMRKVCPLPKVPKCAEVSRNSKESERKLSGICGHVAK